MKYNIKDIASIQTGLFAKPELNGDLVYLQVRYFDDSGRLTQSLNPDIAQDTVSANHVLQTGDVLFAAKGTKNFAAIFEAHNQPAVASTSFLVIRIYAQHILPEYLVWFLNNPNTLEKLKNEALGTSLPSISKQAMEELEISVPSIKKQQLIVKIAGLQHKQLQLLSNISKLHDKLIQQQLTQAINS